MHTLEITARVLEAEAADLDEDVFSKSKGKRKMIELLDELIEGQRKKVLSTAQRIVASCD